ncbi:MAG: hypothetical protein IJI71_08570, partial [Clostridia bacterium]|nr:hypothetical protein [Clostridia bacterium]
MTTGAWAQEQSEAFTTATSNQLTYTGTHFTITGQSIDSDGLYITGLNSNTNNQPNTVTISAINGETITRIEAVVGYNSTNSFTVVATPGTVSGSYSKDGTITISNINASTVTLSSSESNNKLLQFRTWTVYYTAAASTVTVAWNKAENSGSFTMPGGNVTLEPEYYPQAALAAAPTAINDVPATTDGAIVEAGTVANIGETTTAQGTVMYYVSPTALDDAALQALAADQWTADVPTAADLAQGQAYVYYYVRGNDSDNDDEIFSDGDILATNAIQVTLAAAPTYAVTFADGVNPEPPAEPEWTASPNADVTKGETVTVTYTGTKKVIGVKAEKKGSAVKVTAITLNKTATTISAGQT